MAVRRGSARAGSGRSTPDMPVSIQLNLPGLEDYPGPPYAVTRSRTLNSSFHRRPSRATHHNCRDRKSTRLNSSHLGISYAVFCLKKKKKQHHKTHKLNARSYYTRPFSTHLPD